MGTLTILHQVQKTKTECDQHKGQYQILDFLSCHIFLFIRFLILNKDREKGSSHIYHRSQIQMFFYLTPLQRLKSKV